MRNISDTSEIRGKIPLSLNQYLRICVRGTLKVELLKDFTTIIQFLFFSVWKSKCHSIKKQKPAAQDAQIPKLLPYIPYRKRCSYGVAIRVLSIEKVKKFEL